MLNPRLYEVLAEALDTNAGRFFTVLLVSLLLVALLVGVYVSH